MRSYLISLFFLFVFFVYLSSCLSYVENEFPDFGNGQKDTLLQLKSVAVYNERPGSGSGPIREFVNGDTIGLYLHEYHRGNPLMYTVRENYGWWLPEPVFLSSEPIRLFAYYPYRSKDHAYLSEKYVNVEHISQTDYMHGQVNGDYVSRDKPYAEIIMKHALALVQFKFIKNDYPHDCSVQRVSIQNANGVTHLKSKGILNLESGEVAIRDDCYDQATITPEDMNFYEPYTGEEEYARILVMPIEPVRNDGDLFFEFEIDGYIYTYPLKAGTHWQSGMKYTYEVDMVPPARTFKSSGAATGINVVLTQTSSY
ncbi:fimbrillin family protein [Dysgonomonas sp. GY75]|uniref:fimbrillin family protein n=1 Tax=Dysgonomonas sp. GY75 TaxID=2780419 RepID=UPI0018833BEE|nr:fimbrillin family protein [Dysgonomonas sp. GY75]MBF0647995.1 fimbrillin family protein [Dysgonomonas sp. GY75]